MSLMHNDIRNLHQRVELLAPAGRWDAFEAVLDAGADAIYLSSKQFNMRSHRRDFHFDLDQLARAVEQAHGASRRIYLTLNALLGEQDLAGVREQLPLLTQTGIDAIIIQDLAVTRIVRELGLTTPLHASTMMNVHTPEQARVLQTLGVTRVVTSRDISLAGIGAIGRLAGIEVECFVHGDMCVAQSGQCTMSGALFGKSANRGECMKPCRWEYDLVRLDEDEAIGTVTSGHLLAIKDLCLIRNLPEVIDAGICSLKIEGRMRDAAYLGRLVASYRQAIDAYYACPPSFGLQAGIFEQAFRQQVRQLSSLTLLGSGSHRGHFDISGEREPLFLSNGAHEPGMDEHLAGLNGHGARAPRLTRLPDLAVSVADAAGARAAMDAGADRIYLAAEQSQLHAAPGSRQAWLDVADEARSRGIRVGLRTPRVTTSCEWTATRWLLEQFEDRPPDFVLVHHLGTLALAQETCPDAAVIADYGMNLLNSTAVAVLRDLGARQATFSCEAGLSDLSAMAASCVVPLELLAHGPMPGMLVDHCLIALNVTAGGRKDVCRGPCRHVAFGLRDKTGQIRPIVADQYCRNHLLTGHDLAIWPVLERFLFDGVQSLRIEAHLDSPDHIARITRAYRHRLDTLGDPSTPFASTHPLWQDLARHSVRPLNLGPYARSVVDSRPTVEVMRSLVRESPLAP